MRKLKLKAQQETKYLVAYIAVYAGEWEKQDIVFSINIYGLATTIGKKGAGLPARDYDERMVPVFEETNGR